MKAEHFEGLKRQYSEWQMIIICLGQQNECSGQIAVYYIHAF